MSDDDAVLTSYLGERDRAAGGFAAERLVDCYARHELRASVVLRGALGFGTTHQLHNDHVLSLSEDLPVVCVAVDRRERIAAVLDEARALSPTGLATLQHARRLAALAPDDAIRLTVYLGRKQRVAGRPAHVAAVELLHGHGVAGATVLLGVDGSLHGLRQRAAFFDRNADVPLVIVAVGAASTIGAVLPALDRLLAEPPVTLERVHVCKRDGAWLARPAQPPDGEPSRVASWQQLTVYAGEQSRHAGHPLAPQLVARLRAAGAAGATSVRGIWGYHGDHEPHGDRFRSLRRHVPRVTVCIDTPERAERWLALIDELTDETGLVTSELVTVYRPGEPPSSTA